MVSHCQRVLDMRVVAIVQSRLASTRLPGKALLDICGKPMLWHVVDRVSRAKMIDKVVVATTTKDAEIQQLCSENNIPCYAGSELDILERTYKAARWSEADIVVRIWGSCPLIDPGIIDAVVTKALETKCEYCYNTDYPKGLDVAVLPFSVLSELYWELQDHNQRHWFHEYCKENLKSEKVISSENLTHLNLDIDTQEDLDFVRRIMEHV